MQYVKLSDTKRKRNVQTTHLEMRRWKKFFEKRKIKKYVHYH